MEKLTPFLQAMVLVPLTLLPIINPVGNAPIFIAATGTDDRVIQRMARQVAINCFFILVVSMLVGTYVLEAFGISLPIVRVGGGLLVAATAWRMLSQQGPDAVQTAVAESAVELSDHEIARRSFFPMSFPLTAGPGTIAASIALGAKLPSTLPLYLLGAGVAAVGAVVTAAVIYLSYRHAAVLLNKLGDIGAIVMTRLAAFILLCIGIEILWTGWAELNNLAP